MRIINVAMQSVSSIQSSWGQAIYYASDVVRVIHKKLQGSLQKKFSLVFITLFFQHLQFCLYAPLDIKVTQ